MVERGGRLPVRKIRASRRRSRPSGSPGRVPPRALSEAARAVR